MRSSFRLVVAALFISMGACGRADPDGGGGGGGDVEFSPLYKSGTRLRARVSDAGGGAVQFSTWHDTVLDEDCYFSIVGDGTTRCLPNGQGTEYSNPSCTTPVAVNYQGTCSTPVGKYAVVYPRTTSQECGVPYMAPLPRPIGASLGIGDVFDWDGTKCVPGSTQVERFAVGDELPADTFVKQTSEVDELHGAIGVRVLHAEDGAEQIVTLYLTEENQNCYIEGYGDDTSPCIGPVGYLYDGIEEGPYSDPSCTQATAYIDKCQTPAMIARYEIAACSSASVRYYELGAEVPHVYQPGPTPDSCVEATDGSISYSLGAEIDPKTLPSVHTTEIGSGRLVVQGWATEDGTVVQGGSWFDSEAAQLCSNTAFDDDPTRTYCLPTVVSAYGGVYADAGCTQDLAQYDPGTCAPVQPELALTYDPMNCTGGAKSLNQLVEFTSPTVYEGVPGSCTPLARSDIFPATTSLFAIGAEVPRESYPSYENRLE